MSYSVIQPPAKRDIQQICRWLGRHSREKVAVWHFEFTKAIESLENFPRRCSLALEDTEFDYEIRQLIFQQYRILFTIRDETVRILHVIHMSRKPLAKDK